MPRIRVTDWRRSAPRVLWVFGVDRGRGLDAHVSFHDDPAFAAIYVDADAANRDAECVRSQYHHEKIEVAIVDDDT